MARAKDTLVARVWSDVFAAQIISSSIIRWAGLKKCRPIMRPGSSRMEAISVIGRADVLVAKIASGPQIPSSFFQMSCLTVISSRTASIIRSASFKSAREVVVESLFSSMSSRSACFIFLFLMGYAKVLRTESTPFSKAPLLISHSTVLNPPLSSRLTIPDPMTPPPSMATFLILAGSRPSMRGSLPAARVFRKMPIRFLATSDTAQSANNSASRLRSASMS